MNNPDTPPKPNPAEQSIPSREPRPLLAARHRLAALSASWRSSALWKMHDAEMSDDENEAIACRREAQSFEVCASNVEALIRNFPRASDHDENDKGLATQPAQQMPE